MELVLDILSWALILAGAGFCVIGGVGVLRFPDVYTRMHAAGVVDTTGAGFMLAGLMLQGGLRDIPYLAHGLWPDNQGRRRQVPSLGDCSRVEALARPQNRATLDWYQPGCTWANGWETCLGPVGYTLGYTNPCKYHRNHHRQSHGDAPDRVRLQIEKAGHPPEP